MTSTAGSNGCFDGSRTKWTVSAPGEQWHRQLVTDMALEIPGVRRALITADLAARLQEYLAFRHAFRHVYGYLTDAERIRALGRATTRNTGYVRGTGSSVPGLDGRIGRPVGALTAGGETQAAQFSRWGLGRRSPVLPVGAPAEPLRFAAFCVAFRSKYTRASSPGGGSSLTRLVSRAPRSHREDWPASALTRVPPQAA